MKYSSLCVVTLCATLAAQERPAADRFVPKDSCLVVRVAAPSIWQGRFAKTQLGKLLQGPTLAPMMVELDKAVESSIEDVRSSGKFDADLLQKLRTEYRGELVLSLQIDFADLPAAIEEGREPRLSAVLALTPDGSTDLAALGGALGKLIEEMGDEQSRDLRDVTVGEHKLRASFNDGAQVTLPSVIDGHLVMVLATDLEAMGAKLLATEDRAGSQESGAPLHVQADLREAWRALMGIVEKQSEGAPFDMAPLLTEIGITAMETLSLSLDTEGTSVTLAADLGLQRDRLGIMGAMLLDRGTPKLMRYVPPGAEHWSAGGIDLGALVGTMAKVWSGLGDAVPMTFDDAMAAFTEAMKVRLQEDLIAHVGNDMLVLTDIEDQLESAGDEEEDVLAALGGSCIVLSLQDGKKFGESLETALRARGLHAARKSEDYQGTKLYTLRLAGAFEIEYAITDDMLLLALGDGEQTRQNLRGVLDARAAGGHDLPEDLQKRLEGVREGWTGLAVTPIDSTMETIGDVLTGLQEQAPVPMDVDSAIATFKGVARDLRQLGLQKMVSLSYMVGSTWQTRVRW